LNSQKKRNKKQKMVREKEIKQLREIWGGGEREREKVREWEKERDREGDYH
jgi:hypothetical protein